MICERIASGSTIREIEAEDGMPSWPTIRRWLIERDDFRTRYARARDDQADALFAEALIEARGAKGDDANGIQARRLLVDTAKWAAARLAPKRYGDRQHHEVDVPSGITFRVARPGELDDAGNVKK